ncbi:hypothetical protein, partial [Nocardioides stalactiti]|uniref:hypothetical protein n=1 Tax=Nocardioides stalactiti TaxID=2755356 RepID=UPI0028A8F3AD
MKVRLGLLATSAVLLLLVGCGGGNEAAQPSDASAQDNGGDTGPTELAEDLPTAVSTATADAGSTEATTAEST